MVPWGSAVIFPLQLNNAVSDPFVSTSTFRGCVCARGCSLDP